MNARVNWHAPDKRRLSGRALNVLLTNGFAGCGHVLCVLVGSAYAARVPVVPRERSVETGA